MIAAAVLLHRVPLAPYGPIEFWATSPNLFLAKGGSVLVLLSAAACLTRWRRTVPRAVSILSGESLTVYFVHVCILYGSIWNDGLYQAIGPRLGLAETAGWAAILIGSMALLAWLWHACKHASWEMSAAIRTALAVVLVYVIT